MKFSNGNENINTNFVPWNPAEDLSAAIESGINFHIIFRRPEKSFVVPNINIFII